MITMEKRTKVIGLLVIALLALNGGVFTMVTGDQSYDLAEGDTVDIPFKWTYDTAGFALLDDNTKARVVLDYIGYDEDDEAVLTWSVEADETYQDTFEFDVKGDEGDEYKVNVEIEVLNSDGSWVGGTSEDYTFSVSVVSPSAVPEDEVTEDTDDDTETEDSENIEEIDFDTAIIAGSGVVSVALLILIGFFYTRNNGDRGSHGSQN